MRAVVLAAGFGTRMRPLTQVVPKPLLPLWGVPVIEHVLRMLRGWGVREVLVNAHHGADALLAFLRHRSPDGLRVAISFEPQLLGTGGALRRASWFLDDQPFWVVNADIAAELDPRALLRALRRPNTEAALWLHPERGPRTVEMRGGAITSFRSPTPGAEGTFTFCGLQLVRPSVVDRLPEGFSSIVEGYELAVRDGRRIAGVVVPGAYWRDVGRPEEYLEAHAELLGCHREGKAGAVLVDPATLGRARGARIAGFAAIGSGTTLEAGASVERSVLLEGVHLGSRASVSNAVVASGVHLNREAEHLVLPAAAVLTAAERAALAPRGWAGDTVAAECLPPRGSDRTFFRLHRGRRSAMLVRYGRERPENRLYAGHARFLDGLGVRVPRVLTDAPRQGFTLFEDLGRTTLERCINEGTGPRRIRNLYRRVLDMAYTLHQAGTHAARRQRLLLMPGFTPALYRWERDLFARHFLADTLGFRAGRIRHMLADLGAVARELKDADRALLHRDLQSGNVLVKGSTAGLIDFQGMRFGPAAYDLASLLCDPYAMPSPALREEMLCGYAARGRPAERAVRLFAWAAVQRLAQALGAYGRLAGLPGGAGYRTFMRPATDMMRTMVDDLPRALSALADGLDAAREQLASTARR